MLEWNALRVGDQVLVHDDLDPAMALSPGVVATIRTRTASNDLAIRVSDSGGKSAVVSPRRLAVHLQQLDPDELCWRCAISNAAQSTSRKRSERSAPTVGIEPAVT